MPMYFCKLNKTKLKLEKDIQLKKNFLTIYTKTGKKTQSSR